MPVRTTPIRFSIHGIPVCEEPSATAGEASLRRNDFPTVPISPVTTQTPLIPARNASLQLWDFKNDSIAPSKLRGERKKALSSLQQTRTHERTLRYRSAIAREEGKMGERMNSFQSHAICLRLGRICLRL